MLQEMGEGEVEAECRSVDPESLRGLWGVC